MAASEQPRLPTPQLRVLLVEEEIMITLLLEEMLAELDFEVVGPVARLDRAVKMAQRQALDVVLLDVNLNGKEIYPIAEAPAAREVPFVFVTGYGRGTLRAPYCDRPTLRKPFRRDDLRELLAEVCSAKQA
jgi:DNA-binding response OmpR family regulator